MAAKAWDNLRILHTCDPRVLGTLDNAVPVLENLGIYEEVDYYAPDGRAYSRDNQSLQTFRAPSLKSIAIYGAMFYNLVSFINNFHSTILELKLVWPKGYGLDEDEVSIPPPFIHDDELPTIGWNCSKIEHLELSIQETFEELVGKHHMYLLITY